jgi:hypothetical protein
MRGENKKKKEKRRRRRKRTAEGHLGRKMVYVQGGNVVGSRTENKMRGGFILDFFWGILNGIVLL